MKLRKVDPRTIKVPEVRVTARFEPEVLAQFQASVAEVGQITPPICYEVEGELVVCDGLHRIQEAISSGSPQIQVAVLPGDMVDVLSKNLMLDHLRGKHAVSEMVKVIGSLYTDHGLDSDQIRERTGLSRNYLERLIKISQASPTVLQALDEGIIGVGHAFEVSRLPAEVQQDEVIAKQALYRFTVPELREQIDSVLREMEGLRNGAPPNLGGEDPPAAVYHCEGCKGETAPRYLRPVMLCPVCFGNTWRLAQETRAAAVASGDEGGGA